MASLSAAHLSQCLLYYLGHTGWFFSSLFTFQSSISLASLSPGLGSGFPSQDLLTWGEQSFWGGVLLRAGQPPLKGAMSSAITGLQRHGMKLHPGHHVHGAVPMGHDEQAVVASTSWLALSGVVEGENRSHPEFRLLLGLATVPRVKHSVGRSCGWFVAISRSLRVWSQWHSLVNY